MKDKKHTKLKNLMAASSSGGIMTSAKTSELGITPSDIQKYKKSGWVESVGRGAIIRTGEKKTWQNAVSVLKDQEKIPVHIGGKTALEMQGLAHYIKMRQADVFIYSPQYTRLPSWFTNYRWDVKFKHIRTNFLPITTEIALKEIDNFNLSLSSPERAILEVIYLLNKHHSFEECNTLMEGLTYLRPQVIQQLLEACQSIIVKRVFLFLADHNQHKWIKKIDLSKIDLGHGDRSVVKQGAYDPTFKITYPKSLKEDDHIDF